MDFTVTFDDGEVYSGRYDLTRKETPNLTSHINGFLDWYVQHGQQFDNNAPDPREIAEWRQNYRIGD